MQQQINFYQPEFRTGQKNFSSAMLLQASATIALAMLLGYSFATRQLTDFELELQSIARQETAAVGRLERLQPVIAAVSNGKSWVERLDDATRLLEEKQLVLSLVQGSSFGDTRGFSRHLRSLTHLKIDGIWLTSIRLSALGDSTRLEGRALRPDLVPAYLQYLAEEPPFSDQRFHQLQIDRVDDDAAGMVAFSVTSDAEFIAQTVSYQ